MSNTLEDIRRKLRLDSVAQGWGAIVVLSRARLNSLLEQEFIASFGRHRYLPLISGETTLDADGIERVQLSDVQLGTPWLSFNSASLTDSRALLRMSLLGGRYTALHRPYSAPRALASSFEISQAQGFQVEMDIDLSMVVGAVDQQGQMSLDLSRAVNVRCNLAGDDALASQRLGELFQRQLRQLTAGRGVFRLGMLDLKLYGQLAPVGFRILTQAAPGARVAGALNWGDGAVVVFIRLQANGGDGAFPPTVDFPYLIPSDRHPDGSPKYTASLLLAKAVRPYLQVEVPRLFHNLSFPGGHVYERLDLDTLHDVVSFGRISPAQGSLQLQPAFAVLQAGRSQDFTLLDGQGRPVSGANWQAISLDSHDPASHGSISNGRYSAPQAAVIGHRCLNVVVTARVGTDPHSRQVSALLLVVFDSMAVAPRVAVRPVHEVAAPVRLSASTLYTTPDWTLSGQAYGELAQSGEFDALFAPGPGLGRKSLVAQRLEARGDQTQPATLLLPAGQQLLAVEPFAASQVRRASQLALHDDPSLLPGLPRRWSVIGGGGSVSDSGVFSAPAEGITADSVVLCEIVHNDVVFSSGYSVVELSELEQEPDWKELRQFTVKTSGFVDPSRGELYGNGYQQLQLEIVVETIPVGERPAPLSAREQDSIRLRELQSNQDVLPVESELDMDDNDPVRWRTNTVHNRFDLARSGQSLTQEPLQSNPSRVVLTRLLHSRAADDGEVKFIAVFQQEKTSRWWQSDDRGESNGVVSIISRVVPTYDSRLYSLERTRVDGGAPSPGGPEEDEFDYHLRTVDYWTLAANAQMGADFVFQTLRFVDPDGRDDRGKVSKSTIRWESEALLEEMFSWTGYAFKDPKGLDDYPDQQYLQFDDDLGNIVRAGSEANDERRQSIPIKEGYPVPGTLLVSMHRSDRVGYVAPGSSSYATTASPVRDRLYKGLHVLLRDQRGNLHRRLIAFDDPNGAVGHRNRLVHRGF